MIHDQFLNEYYGIEILRVIEDGTDWQKSVYVDIEDIKFAGYKVDVRDPDDIFDKACKYLIDQGWNVDEAKIDMLYNVRPAKDLLLAYRLIRTNKRLTFDICYQNPRITETKSGDENRTYFKASNGVEVISCSRMDLHSQKIWLHGAERDQCADRSGSLVFPIIRSGTRSITSSFRH